MSPQTAAPVPGLALSRALAQGADQGRSDLRGGALAAQEPAAVVTVVTTDGRRLEKRLQYSKGHPKNPFSNEDLTAKFMDSFVPLLGSDRAKRIAETLWNIEPAADASSLVKLSVKTA
jgi:2-methylcitrate dehydratase PrpD